LIFHGGAVGIFPAAPPLRWAAYVLRRRPPSSGRPDATPWPPEKSNPGPSCTRHSAGQPAPGAWQITETSDRSPRAAVVRP